MTSVKFADGEFMARISKTGATAEAIEGITTTNPEGVTITNLDLFMRALNGYLAKHPRINQSMTVMVRQLQPTQWGLPIELYCFSADTRWTYYETLQAEIISYVVALAPLFELKIYQAPSSYDVKA